MKSILTVLRGKLRNRKANFVRICILSLFLSLVLSISLSISLNVISAVAVSLDNAKVGDFILYYFKERPTPEQDDLLAEDAAVKRMEIVEGIAPIVPEDVLVGGKEASQATLFQVYDVNKLPYPIMNPSTTTHIEPKAPESGKIYVPVNFKVEYEAKIGDKVEIVTPSYKKTFAVEAYIEDMTIGTQMIIGSKNVFLNQKDYAELAEAKEAAPKELSFFHCYHLYKSDAAQSDYDFAKTVDKTAGIRGMSEIALAKVDFIGASAVMPTIFSAMLLLFALLLLLITWIIMNFNIATGIQEDYANLGVLKALGQTGSQLAGPYFLEYALAMFFGMAAGLLVATPLMHLFSKPLLPIVGILISVSMRFSYVLPLLGILLVFTMLFALIKLLPLRKISPMRAIAGGRPEVYFSSRLQIPIRKSFCQLRLAFRQLQANFKEYFSSVFIVAFLLFFVLTVSATFYAINPDTMMVQFNGFDFDYSVLYLNGTEKKKEVEAEIRQHSEITKSYLMDYRYFSFDDDSVLTFVVEDADLITTISEGRTCKYKNETVVTKIYADNYGIKIGDTVTLGYKGKTAEYLVTGFYQSINNAGKSFCLLPEGMERLSGDEEFTAYNYLLQDPSVVDELTKDLTEKYKGEVYLNSAKKIAETLESITTAAGSATALILIVDLIFVAITAHMLCSKSIVKDSKDFAIYKAIGMDVSKIRAGFTLRFLLNAAIGVVLGIGLQKLLGNKLLSLMLQYMGISNFTGSLNLLQILVPSALILLCFTGFAYLVSGRIRRVELRELIAD